MGNNGDTLNDRHNGPGPSMHRRQFQTSNAGDVSVMNSQWSIAHCRFVRQSCNLWSTVQKIRTKWAGGVTRTSKSQSSELRVCFNARWLIRCLGSVCTRNHNRNRNKLRVCIVDFGWFVLSFMEENLHTKIRKPIDIFEGIQLGWSRHWAAVRTKANLDLG